MPINRLVAFVLGPLITLAAGAAAAVGAKYGLSIPQKTVAGALTTGAVAIAPMVLSHLKIQKWLDGYQKWEQRADDATNGQLDAASNALLAAVAKKVGVAFPSDGGSIADYTATLPASFTVEPSQPLPEATAPPAAPTDGSTVTDGPGSASAGAPPPVAQPGAFEGANEPSA